MQRSWRNTESHESQTGNGGNDCRARCRGNAGHRGNARRSGTCRRAGGFGHRRQVVYRDQVSADGHRQ
jgi:hypothetical protein